MTLHRAHARRVGFVLVVAAGIWFELSPWGERVSGTVLDAQLLALGGWAPPAVAGDVAADVDGGGPASAGVRDTSTLSPLSAAVTMSLVVVGALVWWESRFSGWAVASSLAALAALFAVSTMMLPRGVLVPTAGPGLAIVAAALGRRLLEAVIALRDRGAAMRRQEPAP